MSIQNKILIKDLLSSIFKESSISKKNSYTFFKDLYPMESGFTYFNSVICECLKFIRDDLKMNGYGCTGTDMAFTSKDGCIISTMHNECIFIRINIQGISSNNPYIIIENGIGYNTLTTISINNPTISNIEQTAISNVIMSVIAKALNSFYIESLLNFV